LRRVTISCLHASSFVAAGTIRAFGYNERASVGDGTHVARRRHVVAMIGGVS